MAVIDVDSHFEIAVSPDEHPLRSMRDVIPPFAEMIAEAVAGDLLRSTPEQDQPSSDVLAALLPGANRASGEYAAFAGADEPGFRSMSVGDRVAWCDEAGIEFALINPGAIGISTCTLRERRAEAMRLSNDFLVDYIDGRTARFSPVTLIDWTDLEGAIAELTRMRAAGSRAFWIRAQAHGGVSPAHRDWDRVWSAATDLGMVAILHVGNTPAAFAGGWGNASWMHEGGTGLGGFFRFANSMRHQAAEMMLAAMLFGGVFGRHPGLTVITEEVGVSWIPHLVERCDQLAPAGPWPFELTPGEMIRRHLRAAPLPGLGDANPLSPALESIKEMLVFSSDHPHEEGNRNPIELLEPTLGAMSEVERASFLGGNIAECFARMGDPLGI